MSKKIGVRPDNRNVSQSVTQPTLSQLAAAVEAARQDEEAAKVELEKARKALESAYGTVAARQAALAERTAARKEAASNLVRIASGEK